MTLMTTMTNMTLNQKGRNDVNVIKVYKGKFGFLAI